MAKQEIKPPVVREINAADRGKVVKNGNAYHVHISKDLMAMYGIKPGDRVDYVIKNVVIGMFPHNLQNLIAFA